MQQGQVVKVSDFLKGTKRFRSCLEYDVLVGLEETEHAVEMKIVERGVEEITGERGHHAAEERHPAELQTPE